MSKTKETRKAAAPKASAEILASALTEINQGLPAGALIPAAQPMVAAQPVAPAQPDQPVLAAGGTLTPEFSGDWQQRLQQMASAGARLDPTVQINDQEKLIASIQDEAVQAQNKTLNKMFSDMGGAVREGGPRLPASVDRYLDKILS